MTSGDQRNKTDNPSDHIPKEFSKPTYSHQASNDVVTTPEKEKELKAPLLEEAKKFK